MLENYVAVDIETTGLNSKNDRILEIGAVKIEKGQIKEVFDVIINPGIEIPDKITQLTGIDRTMTQGAPYVEEVIGEFIEFTGDNIILGHNLIFDYSFLKVNAVNNNYEFEKKGIDTLKLARKYLADIESRRLDYLCSYFGISDENHHRAVNDAKAALDLYKILCEKYENGSEFEPEQMVYKVKKQGPITPAQKRYLLDLVKYHNISIDYEVDKLRKNEASRIIDGIILSKGRIFR